MRQMGESTYLTRHDDSVVAVHLGAGVQIHNGGMNILDSRDKPPPPPAVYDDAGHGFPLMRSPLTTRSSWPTAPSSRRYWLRRRRTLTMSRGSAADSDLVPSWDWICSQMRDTSRPDAARRAGLWALGVLRPFFGDDWVARFHAAAKHVPGFLLQAPSHSVALVEVLEWAARIDATRNVPGSRSVRRHLQRDLVEHRVTHTALQLELAALAATVGTSSFEVRLGSESPVDVVIAHGSGSIPIEAFVLNLDDRMREGFRNDDDLSNGMSRVRFQHDVEFDGELRAPLAGAELADWLKRLDAVATRVSASGEYERLTDEHSDVNVVPGHLAGDLRFSGPPRIGRGWDRTERRLRDKGEQARASGARWLRVDIRDGLWQFSSWSTRPFPERVDNIAAATALALAGLGLDGIVVSSGACQLQGDYIGQSRPYPEHLGMGRRLDYFRARETVILPLTEQGHRDANIWHLMYEAEPSWLDAALAGYGQPSLAEVFTA
jgi:hypothetical protein